MWNTLSLRMRQPVSNFSSAWIDAPLRSSRLSFERCATTTKSAVCSGTTLSVLNRKPLHRAIVAHPSLHTKKTNVLVVVSSFQVLCGSRRQLHRHDTFSAAKNSRKCCADHSRSSKDGGPLNGTRNGPQDKENERPPTVNVEPPKVEFSAFSLANRPTRSVIEWCTEKKH